MTPTATIFRDRLFDLLGKGYTFADDLRTDSEGEQLSKGQRVLIDIYGTNRDERHWDRPERFDPERFLGTDEVFADYFIPQGGGRVEAGHRCPGEAVTVGLLAQTASELSRLDARVARDGLDFPLRRMPTMPRNGVLLSEVSRRAEAGSSSSSTTATAVAGS